MNLKEIPDLPASKYSKRFSVALSESAYKKLKELRAQGKDTSEFVRQLIDRALSEKKAG